MIKKIIACLTICFIITGIISPVFSYASALPQPNWSDPGISEIINISDLTGWMLNGGTYDVSTYTDAESFMNDYFNVRTQTRLVSPDEVQEDYYEVLPVFGINNQLVAGESFANPLDTNRVIASSFRDHTGYGRRLSNEVNEALLSSGSLYDTKIPLLNEIEFANFVGYNHDALRLYSEFFQNDNPTTTNPDPLFSDICSYLEGYVKSPVHADNEWIDFSTCYFRYNLGSGNYPLTANYPFSIIWDIGNIVQFTDVGSVYLTSNLDGSYEAAYSFPIKNCFYNSNNVPSNYTRNITWLDKVGNEWTGARFDTLSTTDRDISSVANYHFIDISAAMNYLKSHFTHINLYVDNVLWAYAGETSSITPEFPDSVGGEDLPATTWPIFRPHAPYYTSVPGVLQAIEDAIADDGKLDIDDLKPYLTDENGDPVPDPIFDPEPVPIPVPDPVNPDIVPGLPVLPAIPLEMPGFNGVSVLAEIINFTNQSLPTALIVTFWGIVFGIVILGLIKILHK